MAELALGILGVVPLIGGAIKAYKQVNGKLKAFRHCSKEAKKIQKVLRIQQQVFSNECRLWLRFAIEDDEIVSEMASDPEHENWGDASLESCLRTRLKNNYEPWVEIIQDITGYVEELENGIRKFVIEKENKSTEGRLKKTLKRTQDGVKMAFSASDFDILIGELRSSNDDLKDSESRSVSCTNRPNATRRMRKPSNRENGQVSSGYGELLKLSMTPSYEHGTVDSPATWATL
ncbi:hypothetical protein CSPAE12_00333 [Colletotrichum incanum]|nr:hypothetical protein CSPAE12_00333 [Colletotrichum incanum]